MESDDKKIEKKDKNLDEPVQFYTGKDKLLYELVINTINKNQVIGYLATPKNAPSAHDPVGLQFLLPSALEPSRQPPGHGFASVCRSRIESHEGLP